MDDPGRLAQALKQRARQLGFSLVGITAAAPSRHMEFYRSWIDAGHHGEMGYLAREDAVNRRADLVGTMPESLSVLTVAHEYYQPDPAHAPDDPARAVIARYARGEDYHEAAFENGLYC